MSATEEASADEIQARRERLLALKAKAGQMPNGAAAAAAPNPAAAAPAANGPAADGGEGGGDAAFGGDRSKYFATFLLNTLRTKPEGEDNPEMVPGTAFTVFGMEKLLEGLGSRSDLIGATGKGITKRFHDFLTHPAEEDQQMSHGVNLEHLERFVNFLSKMQATGWDGVKSDFMQSSDGKGLLEAFSKPRIEKIEAVVNALKAEVETLKAEVAALKAK